MTTRTNSERSSTELVFSHHSDHPTLLDCSRSRAIINREQRDCYNRLHSIAEDAEFVFKVSNNYKALPVIANQRCGAWYVDPTRQSVESTIYFKSTDGHDGQWQFSTRRANLHLLPVILLHGGVLLVDSTRRGKRFPDALSKTVPLWCAVLNAVRARLEDRYPINSNLKTSWHPHHCSQGLFTLPSAVRRSEHDQIQKQVNNWADQLLRSGLEVEAIVRHLQRPLRPIWVSPASQSDVDNFLGDISTLDFHPVICVSASKWLSDDVGLDRGHGYSYIQGAGDDHEGWANGMTPALFWTNHSRLLSATRAELPTLIEMIVKSSSTPTTTSSRPFEVRHTGLRICLDGSETLPQSEDRRLVVEISTGGSVRIRGGQQLSDQLFEFKGDHRRLKNLSATLSAIVPILVSVIQDLKQVILCLSGSTLPAPQELLVAIALSVLVNAFDDDGNHREKPIQTVDKTMVRNRLHWLVEASGGALNPPRAILKLVNNYLIRSRRPTGL